MLGGSYRASFRPLNDAIMSGRIRGVAAIVGCNNPRSKQDYLHTYVTKELLKQDVLIVETGCGAIAAAKIGLLLGEAGPGPGRTGLTGDLRDSRYSTGPAHGFLCR
jgi:anaerobic carbon-monoxide dehydrogenase catalytic subunit